MLWPLAPLLFLRRLGPLPLLLEVVAPEPLAPDMMGTTAEVDWR